MSVQKWRIQRERFAMGSIFSDPATWMWFAYPPERDRKPYMVATWREAIDWAEHVSRRKAAGRP